jgi:hypothetical protein
MTLDTRVYVHDEVDVHELFAECRRLLGADESHRSFDGPSRWSSHRDSWTVGNGLGQGLPALLAIDYRPGAPLRPDGDACSAYCDPEDDRHYHQSAMWCEVSFDTAYGYADSRGGCGALHARLVFDLGQWLDERGVAWSWRNEFDGEVHGGDERYVRLRDLADDGQEAMRWFKGVVEPAIAAHLRAGEEGSR